MAIQTNQQELVDLLTPIPGVQVSNEQPPTLDPQDYDSLDVFIYDVRSDWHGLLEPVCPHAHWMREAFYFINCDYNLARYVTWPWYQESSSIDDPYVPYFHLWRHGAILRCQSPDRVTIYVGTKSFSLAIGGSEVERDSVGG